MNQNEDHTVINERPAVTNLADVTGKNILSTVAEKERNENKVAAVSVSGETGQQANETVQTNTAKAADKTSQDHLQEEQNNNNATASGNTDAVQEKTGAITHKASRHNGFSIAFVAGVDKSTVKFKYGNDAGINLGMLVGYHFNDRWSLHSGGIYTQKNYKLAGEDFTAPKGTPMSYYKIETLEGYCRMWEVPLVARYTLNPSAKNSTFISTGLSSYFMTKENYSYLYYYNNQPVTRSSSYNSSDTHVLSIWDLSVGFNKPFSKSWGMQVEPYARIPLGGVGLGNIRLSSFGINFSVQYRQPAKK